MLLDLCRQTSFIPCFLLHVRHNPTNTDNNFASLQYNNNSNMTDVAMPAHDRCCGDTEVRRKTQR